MWEYKVLYLFSSELNDTLKKLGEDGWELIGVSEKQTYTLFFKRPIEKTPPSVTIGPFKGNHPEFTETIRVESSDGRFVETII